MPTNASNLGISDGLWRLLTRCWDAEWAKRPQVNEVLQYLYREPARELFFPPSRHPRDPSPESTPASSDFAATPLLERSYTLRGNDSRFKLVRSRAYSSSVAHLFSPISGMSEGMPFSNTNRAPIHQAPPPKPP